MINLFGMKKRKSKNSRVTLNRAKINMWLIKKESNTYIPTYENIR